MYTEIVRNITLSAESHLIERARKLAQDRHTTLNSMFREWLEQITAHPQAPSRYLELMAQLAHVNSAGRKFTREEMNDRHS